DNQAYEEELFGYDDEDQKALDTKHYGDDDEDEWRILDISGQGMWIHGSMEPLHFKPICLAIDGAKSGIAVKVILPSYNASVHLQYYDESLEASFVDLLYSPLGTRSFQTQTTCSSDATPQYSVDESQKQGRQRGIWNGKKTDNTTKICNVNSGANCAMGRFKGYFDILGVRGIMVTYGRNFRLNIMQILTLV
ncbi:hypothetical protein Tco_1371978, partial [Tanacetum coccineum]